MKAPTGRVFASNAQRVMNKMKILIVFLLFVAAAFALTAAPGAGQTTPKSNQDIATANAKQARDVIDKCIKALGGDAYLNIKDIEQEGRGYGFYHNAPAGVGVLYWRDYKYPDKERYEFTKKRDWIIIHNGDKGYEVTYRGSRPEAAKDHETYERRRHYALDFVLREWVHQAGAAFFYEGTTVVGPKTVHQVTIMDAQNQGVTLFIDADSFLPVKKSYTWRDPQYKEMDREEELYDEYRLEQDLPTPHVITRMLNKEMTSQRFITNVKYNSGLSDSVFVPPTLNYDRMKK
jgi:hypothetical protein